MLHSRLLLLAALVAADGPTRQSNGHGAPRISFSSSDDDVFREGGLNEIYRQYDRIPMGSSHMNIQCNVIDVPDDDEVLSKIWEYWREEPASQRGFTSNADHTGDITIAGTELELARFNENTPTRYRCKINTRKIGTIDRQLYIYGQKDPIPQRSVASFDGLEFVLRCGRNTVPEYYDFEWYQRGELLEDGEYDVEIDDDGALRRRHPHSGLYRCTITDDDGKVVAHHMTRITGPPTVVHEHASYNVAEGTERVEMQCFVVDGSPIDKSMRWFYQTDNGGWDSIASKTKSGKLELSENRHHVKDAKLIVHDVTEDDRAKFKCSYAGVDGEAHAEIMLRVKGTLAPLWPALGILLELAVLVIIIALFERRAARKHRELEEQERTEREGLTTPSSKRAAAGS